MDTHLVLDLVKGRLEEARTWAAQQAVLRSLITGRQPMRVKVGLGLVKIGHWLAGDPGTAPRRATA